MPVSDNQVTSVVDALSRDLRSSRLARYLYLVKNEVENARQILDDLDKPERFEEKVVQDVQQDILDQFIDTTWLRCPRHLRHPLWYHDGSWYCKQDEVAIARLGQLPPLPPEEQPWRLRPGA